MNLSPLNGQVDTSPGAPRRRRRRSVWGRATGIGLVTTLLSLGTVSAGAAVTATTTSQTSRVVLAGWDDGQGSYGWGSSDQGSSGQGTDNSQSPWSSGDDSQPGSGGQSSDSSTTPDSRPATKTQSKGVALIDTVLGYQDAAAAGTGIVLTSTGEVLTNYHVVEGATSVKVTIASTRKTYVATVVGHDQSDDIALLKLKGATGLTTAKIDDDRVAAGDQVTAVGNAGGTDSLSAADGTVTSLSQTITTESESGVAGETLKDLIATDADVVPGDSGGPLYDSEGEVIGVDAAASTGSEINGYAIRIDTALEIVTQIRTGKETSTVQVGASPYLGVEIAADSSDSYGGGGFGYRGQDAAEPSSGALVAGVQDGTPAATVGLAAGDTITAVGGTTVTSADQVSTLLRKHDVGDSVKVGWTDSAGGSHTATVKLAASPIA